MQTLPELKARLSQIDAERDPLVRLIEAYTAYEAVLAGVLPTGRRPVEITNRVTPPRRAAPTMDATINAVTAILEREGHPVATGALLDRFEDRDSLALGGDRASNVLSARLSNSPKFETRRGIGWWFADRPWPNENEALNGHAASASETGEVDASPINNRARYDDLLG